jgi:Flp pilus assembly pilin Flp
LVAIAVFAALRIFGGKIRTLFQRASEKIEEAGE